MDNLEEFVIETDGVVEDGVVGGGSSTSVGHVIGVLVPSIFVSVCILALLLMYLIKHHNLREYIITARARLEDYVLTEAAYDTFASETNV